jgi:uncharacterized protein GlcG (DUF336 family)
MIRKLAAIALAAAIAGPAAAQDDDPMVAFEVLEPELALALAEAARDACRAEGFQVAVAVVDRFGIPQAVLRDRFAGPHTVDTSTRKAWTAVSFRTGTQELDERISAGELTASLRDVPGALMLGGGVPVMAAGSLAGGIGVSGAPSPQADETCAEAGIEAISGQLPF